MYESILSAIRQELQTEMSKPELNFPMVRKLTEMALDIQASSVRSVAEVGRLSSTSIALGTGYGPTSTERMIGEVIPQILPMLERKFATDTLGSLSSLLETYMKLSNADTPGHDPELATGVKSIIEKYLKEGDHEDIHTDTSGGHQPDA